MLILGLEAQYFFQKATTSTCSTPGLYKEICR